MRELMEPMLAKGQKDREMIYSLEQVDLKIYDRIELLEMAVFRTGKENLGRTLFDEMDSKILAQSIALETQKVDIQNKIDNFTTKVENRSFEIEAFLTKV